LFFIVLQEKRQQGKKFLKKVDLSFIIKNKSVSLHFISSLSSQRDFRCFEGGMKKVINRNKVFLGRFLSLKTHNKHY
jgi:hypothetical protein